MLIDFSEGMFSFKSLGSVALQSTRNKLVSFSQCNSVINANEPAVTGLLLQVNQNVFDTQVRYRRSCIRKAIFHPKHGSFEKFSCLIKLLIVGISRWITIGSVRDPLVLIDTSLQM